MIYRWSRFLQSIKVNNPAASCGAFTAEQSSWGLPPPNPRLPIHPASKLTGILGILIKGKSWTIPVGIVAASMSMFGGYPVGITDVIRLGRLSMFLPAPIIGTVLLVVLMLPGTKKLIENQGEN